MSRVGVEQFSVFADSDREMLLIKREVREPGRYPEIAIDVRPR